MQFLVTWYLACMGIVCYSILAWRTMAFGCLIHVAAGVSNDFSRN